ncbi:MAG TPA: hypothetical protein VK917_03740 [Ilumatobacter sp.]|nr:hypothetical protein [Ilumatobacter sp.]
MTDTSHDTTVPSLRRRASSRRSVAALAAAAVLVFGAAACAGADDDDADEPGDDPALDSAELDAAIERAEAAEAERDALAAQLEEMDEADPEAIAAMEAELATAQDELALAQLQLEATTARADTAEARVAEVEEIVGQFPIALDSSLIPEDMPGDYRITFQEAYCAGFSTCGSPPGPTTATVYFTPERFLRIGVTGILDAGLFALEGSLYGITDSFTALPACGETQRRARITLTTYAGSVAVQEDGTRVVNDLNASITIDAPDEGPDCPGGLVFYASRLIPAG